MELRQEVRFWLLRIFYICFFIFIINRIFFVSSGMTEQIVSYITYPFLKIHKNIASSLKNKSEHKKMLNDLSEEIDSLIITQESLKARIAQLEAQQLFIDQSRDLIDFAQRYDTKTMGLSKVLLEYSCPQEDVIFIDGGKNRGYKRDDIVVYKNAIVGRIIEIYPWYSKVATVTDQRCKIASVIGTDSHGISSGKNNKILELNFIPHYKKIVVGDLAISSGNGLLFPQGFTVGIVESITTDLVSHKILLKPYFDISEISYVHILLKANIDLVE